MSKLAYDPFTFSETELRFGDRIAFTVAWHPSARLEGVVLAQTKDGKLCVQCADILPYQKVREFSPGELHLLKVLK